MTKKSFFVICIVAFAALWLEAWSDIATPTLAPASAPTLIYVIATPTLTPAANTLVTAPNVTTLGTLSNSGGSVDVNVTPQTFVAEQAMAFKIVMNTHSVDLSDDMTQIVSLRDDQGNEYMPTAWEGAGPGGHHRSGVIKFAGLAAKPKSIDLVIKGLAQVSERTFHWDVR